MISHDQLLVARGSAVDVTIPDDDEQSTSTVETPGQVAVESHELDQTIIQLVVRP